MWNQIKKPIIINFILVVIAFTLYTINGYPGSPQDAFGIFVDISRTSFYAYAIAVFLTLPVFFILYKYKRTSFLPNFLALFVFSLMMIVFVKAVRA